jgi:hypothetical protein
MRVVTCVIMCGKNSSGPAEDEHYHTQSPVCGLIREEGVHQLLKVAGLNLLWCSGGCQLANFESKQGLG